MTLTSERNVTVNGKGNNLKDYIIKYKIVLYCY